MPPPFHTKCGYHIQDGSNFCGAAVAMMVLAQQGQSFTTLDQVTLQGALVLGAPPNVATLPDKLADTLNDRIPDRFRVVPASSAPDVARHVLRSLMQDIPSAVPMYTDNHWTVIEGMDTDVTPAPGQPYEISVVWVHNPMPIAVVKVPPHSLGDNCRLSGSSIVAVHYDYGAWLKLVEQTKGNFRFKCVVSADPDPIDIGFPAAPSPPPPIVPSFNESMAEDTLLDFLRSDGFGKAEVVSRLAPSGQVKAKTIGLVRGLTEHVSDYYLVSAIDDRGFIGLAEIDAKRPWLRSLGVLGSPQENLVPDMQEVLQIILEASLPGLPPHSNNWWHSQLKLARLVWRPCAESLSPYIPFLAVPLGSNMQPQSHVFVRFTIERAAFLELTDPLQGG